MVRGVNAGRAESDCRGPKPEENEGFKKQCFASKDGDTTEKHQFKYISFELAKNGARLSKAKIINFRTFIVLHFIIQNHVEQNFNLE